VNERSTVFLVDDDEAVRDALSLLLRTAGFDVMVFAAASEFLAAYEPAWRGCVILDVVMPARSGPELQEEMLTRKIDLPILFLTAHGNIPTAVRTIKAGAIDFLTKPVDAGLLIQRIQEAFEQDARTRDRKSATLVSTERLRNLTEREREIMMLMVSGMTSKEIARELEISPRTVDIHRSHVMAKTGAANLMELARLVDASQSPATQNRPASAARRSHRARA
jgi:FixJ family two-component response regulator